MEVVKQVHEKNLVAWAKDHPEAVVFSGDLTGSTEIALFKDTYPERFYSMGLGEQNMMSWAGGMAREGYVPFVHTFAVFMYRRSYDQIAMSIAYPGVKVRIIGFLPGITTPGGVSHQAIEDISVMRSLPNMSVVEMGDATEVETVLDAIDKIEGPVYLRMLRGEIPRLFDPKVPFELNKARLLQEGNDLCIISSGICTQEAIKAVQFLQEQGISISHLHISTLKPFTDPLIVDTIKSSKYGVITLENHTVIGGLGTCVAEVMAENGIGKLLCRLGIQDHFAHGASREYLMRECGIDALALIQKAGQVVGKFFSVDAGELTAEKYSKSYVAQQQLD
ncbi:MAG TPA: transketolase C-terminal domain-containing protein, partial [Clostridia bacterium]|nr:transketolase C-terminal domain-containing protein [Clostridia bacterium]